MCDKTAHYTLAILTSIHCLINNGLPTDIQPRRPVSLKPANCVGVVYSEISAKYVTLD